MTQFSVLHILKYKGNLGAIGAHIDRIHVSKNVNNDKIGFNESISMNSSLQLVDILGNHIEVNKSNLLENYVSTSQLSFEKAIWTRIRQGHTIKGAIRKDAVLALGLILTGSHERMLAIQDDKPLFEEWKRANYQFVSKIFGQENIIRFTLHLDEKTPHFHCVVVPITPQGRLSARYFVNGKERLAAYQDQYAATMARFGLVRGVPSTLSHRIHITTKDWYRKMQSLGEEAKKLTASIKKASLFKLNSIREKIQEKILSLQVSLSQEQEKVKHALKTNHQLIQDQEKVVYKRTLEEASKQAYESIKRDIPLIPFLTSRLGWQIDKKKSSRRDCVLKHPLHGRIIVPTTPRTSNGHWVYSNVHGGGGTLIDLLLQEKWDWSQIRSLANDHLTLYTNTQSSFKEETSKSPHHNRLELAPAEQTRQAKAHLERIVPASQSFILEERKIKKETYQGIRGMKVSAQAAVFALYKDFSEKGEGQLCSTITYYKHRQGHHAKYFQKGLPRGLSVLTGAKPLGEAKRIIITESPVDALSHRQLEVESRIGWREIIGEASKEKIDFLHDTIYLSTCGTISMQIKVDLEQLCQVEKPIILAFQDLLYPDPSIL